MFVGQFTNLFTHERASVSLEPRASRELRILALDVTPVRVPLRRPLVTALGDMRASSYAVLRLECDGGVTGLGEVSLIWHGDGAALGTAVAPLLRAAAVGQDAYRRTAILAAAREALKFGKHSLTALAALDMALLDAAGRATGLPAYALVGGAVRDRVLVSMSLSVADVDATVAEARTHVEAGIRALKIKGLRDGAHVAEVARVLRREFGDELSLRVDLNMACRTAKEALAIARALEPHGIRSLEQPLPPDDLAGLAFLRAHTDIPVMLDESVWDETDADRAIAAGALDIANIYVAEAGGIDAGLAIARRCALAGIEVTIGSMPELGIGAAAAAHLAVSLPHLEHPADVVGFRYHAGDVVRHELRVEDGYLLRPDAPGLGVELDVDALARFATGAAA